MFTTEPKQTTKTIEKYYQIKSKDPAWQTEGLSNYKTYSFLFSDTSFDGKTYTFTFDFLFYGFSSMIIDGGPPVYTLKDNEHVMIELHNCSPTVFEAHAKP